MYVCMQKYRLSHFSSPEPVFMMKLRLLLLIPVIIPLLYSCRATKHVGEGEYLLDRISLSTDNRNLKNSELKSYIRQEPNHKTFGLIGLPLFFYNLSNDKDNGWNRWLRRIGTPPVIYDSQLTEKSRSQIEKALYNKGYTDAIVTVDTIKHKKRIKVKYDVKSGTPYHIDRMTYRIFNDSIRKIVISDSILSFVRENYSTEISSNKNDNALRRNYGMPVITHSTRNISLIPPIRRSEIKVSTSNSISRIFLSLILHGKNSCRSRDTIPTPYATSISSPITTRWAVARKNAIR